MLVWDVGRWDSVVDVWLLPEPALKPVTGFACRLRRDDGEPGCGYAEFVDGEPENKCHPSATKSLTLSGTARKAGSPEP